LIEVLATSFDLDHDPDVEKLGALIHYPDVGGVPVPEAVGFEAILRGAQATFTDDDELHTAIFSDDFARAYASVTLGEEGVRRKKEDKK